MEYILPVTVLASTFNKIKGTERITVFALKESAPSETADTKDIVDKFLSEFPKPDYTMKETEAGIAQSDNYGMGLL